MIAQRRISISPEVLAEFCQRHRIIHLGIFGSVLREDFGPDSDIDVLVEFQPGTPISLFKLADIQDELSTLLGRTVDMGLRHSVKPHVRDAILASEEVLYSA